jgi:hypothetical protein
LQEQSSLLKEQSGKHNSAESSPQQKCLEKKQIRKGKDAAKKLEEQKQEKTAKQ